MTRPLLLLASKSAVRASMLRSAGLEITISPSLIDERAVEQPAMASGASAADVARLLAEAKALDVASRHPGALVIGADQTLALGAERYTKPIDADSARAQLLSLRAATHQLASGAALARDGEVLWSSVAAAHLTMRAFTDAFLDDYLARMGESVMSSVGGYHFEGVGAQLFEKVDGDYFTILGLPLLPLLEALRAEGVLER